MTSPPIPTPEHQNDEDKERIWRRASLALLLFLLSYLCIFCSSQGALRFFIPKDLIPGIIRARQQADYSPDSGNEAYAPVNLKTLIEEIANDTRGLDPSLSGIGAISSIVILPKVTPQATDMPLPPVPTPTASSTATPSPLPPTAIAAVPTVPSVTATSPPTPLPPSATAVLPPTPLPSTPTAPIPTASPLPPPTVPPPTVPPPTIPPPTLPPPTSPPPTSPPSPANNPPNAVNDGAITLEDSAVIVDVLFNDSDSDGTLVPASVTVTSGPANGGTGVNTITGEITYTPVGNFNGVDSFVYQICDDDGDCSTATVTVTVTAVNDPPVAADDTGTTFQETAVVINVPSNDTDVDGNLDPTTTLVISGPGNGATAVNPVTGAVTYTPSAGFVGIDTFVYRISDTGLPVYSDTATVTVTIFPQVYFTSSSYNVDENNGPALITVTLSAPAAIPASVNYATSNGTATATNDYTTTIGTLSFLVGQQVLTFTVPIADDSLANEGNETVMLTLSSPVNATLGITNPATLTIIDNSTVTVQFAKADYAVNEGNDYGTGLVTATILVRLSNPSLASVMVNYNTSPGAGPSPATVGSDYLNSAGTLTFSPLETRKTFFVTVISDTIVELNETIGLNLTAPVNATLGAPNVGTLNIIDDDLAGPCPGLGIPFGEPNQGPPDGVYAEIDCGAAHEITLTPPLNADGDSAFDLIYYERDRPGLPAPSANILMDWVIIEIREGINDPWFTIFYWGDDILDENTNIGQAGYGPVEINNDVIPSVDLYGSDPLKTGIAIDIDARVPTGTYQYIRIYTPFGPADAAQVDAFQVLP